MHFYLALVGESVFPRVQSNVSRNRFNLWEWEWVAWGFSHPECSERSVLEQPLVIVLLLSVPELVFLNFALNLQIWPWNISCNSTTNRKHSLSRIVPRRTLNSCPNKKKLSRYKCKSKLNHILYVTPCSFLTLSIPFLPSPWGWQNLLTYFLLSHISHISLYSLTQLLRACSSGWAEGIRNNMHPKNRCLNYRLRAFSTGMWAKDEVSVRKQHHFGKLSESSVACVLSIYPYIFIYFSCWF